MTKIYLSLLCITVCTMATAQVAPCLPESRLFTYPNSNFKQDGEYVEYYSNEGNQVHFRYFLEDGKRNGPIEIYNLEGQKIAEGEFIDNQLKNGVLLVLSNNEEIYLKKDNPGWLFTNNWDCKSGTHESEDGETYVWLAGIRYRLPDEIVALNL